MGVEVDFVKKILNSQYCIFVHVKTLYGYTILPKRFDIGRVQAKICEVEILIFSKKRDSAYTKGLKISNFHEIFENFFCFFCIFSNYKQYFEHFLFNMFILLWFCFKIITIYPLLMGSNGDTSTPLIKSIFFQENYSKSIFIHMIN